MFTGKLFQKMMKHSVLSIGILMMIIFLFQLNDQGHFDRFKSSPCLSTKSVLLKRSPYALNTEAKTLTRSESLERKLPENWSLSCKKNVLYVDIDFKNTKTTSPKTIRRQLYSEMANSLMFISIATKDSFDLNLSKTFFVVLKIDSDLMEIAARTEGKNLAALSNLVVTEKDKSIEGIVEGKRQIILEHLSKSVEVQENPKELEKPQK